MTGQPVDVPWARMSTSKFCGPSAEDAFGASANPSDRDLGGFFSDDRRRDPFPIPLVQLCDHRVEFPSMSQRRRLAKFNRKVRIVNDVIGSLNHLYVPTSVNSRFPLLPTESQRAAQTELLRQVDVLAVHVPVYSWREATRTLLQSCLSYDEAQDTTVRPYQPDLASLPQVGSDPPQLGDLVDDFGQEILEDPLGRMMLSDDEWGEKLEKGHRIQPCMDVVLKSNADQYVEFVHRLYQGGMINFTAHPQDVVCPFFVTKKTGMLRLVLDCRSISQRFKEPPGMLMAAGSTWANLELCSEAEDCLFVAQSDLKDCFYLLGLPSELQPFFALPATPVEAMAAWGIPREASGGESNGGLIAPCFRVVSMGWSWAMFWAQRVHQHQALIGTGLSQDRVLVADRPPPSVEGGKPFIIAYADNVNIGGTDKSKVQSAGNKAVEHLRSLGFGVHAEVEACTLVES